MNKSEILEGMVGRWCGLNVKLNQNLTIPGPLKTVPRSWGDRLFTRPWHPWHSTKMVPTQIPDPKIYKVKVPALMITMGNPYNPDKGWTERLEEMIVAHPETWDKIKLKLRLVK